jgi:hypothetical protein
MDESGLVQVVSRAYGGRVAYGCKQGANPCGTVCPCGQYQQGKRCRNRLRPLLVRVTKPRARPGTTFEMQVRRTLVRRPSKLHPCAVATVRAVLGRPCM